MSLLNKVLRDLDRRKAGPDQPVAPIAGIQPVAPPPRQRRATVWLLTAALAGVAVWGAWTFTDVPARAPAPVQHVAVASPQAPQPAAPSTTMEAVPSEQVATATPPRAEEETPLLNQGLRLVAEIISPIRTVVAVKPEVVTTAKPVRAKVAAAPVESPPASPSSVLAANVQTPTMPEPLLVAVIEKNATPPTAREQARGIVEEGLQAVLQKRPEEAMQRFREALELDPTYDRGRQALLSALITAQDKPGAEMVADEGVIHGQSRVGFALVAARLKLERAAVKQALAVLERERVAGARHPDYMALWGNALARESRHSEAARMYGVAIELAPTNPAHHVGLAYALRNDGQYASAYAVFESVLAMPGLTAQLADLVNQQIGALQRLIVQR